LLIFDGSILIIVGFDGEFVLSETVVDWNAWFNKTKPASVETSIAPVTQPDKSQLGNRINVLCPISSTVVEKSVPRTATVAVGV